MSKTITNPWDLAYSKWWISKNYSKDEVDDMTLDEIQELLNQD
jgi:hypothetical protein